MVFKQKERGVMDKLENNTHFKKLHRRIVITSLCVAFFLLGMFVSFCLPANSLTFFNQDSSELTIADAKYVLSSRCHLYDDYANNSSWEDVISSVKRVVESSMKSYENTITPIDMATKLFKTEMGFSPQIAQQLAEEIYQDVRTP